MKQLIPRIVIIEHEQVWIDRVTELPIIKEIKSKGSSYVKSICMDQLSQINLKLQEMDFNFLIADVYYEGADVSVFTDFGKYIAEEAMKKNACLVILSQHVSSDQFSKLVNDFGVAGILRKRDLIDTGELILRGIINRRFPGFDLRTSTNSMSWLHISDLHYEDRANSNRRKVEDAFIRDLNKHKEECVQLNMILITGDIAASGKPEEYERAENFIRRVLDSTNISNDQLIIVPGNHDVAREKINPILRKVCAFRNRDELAQAMSDTNIFEMLCTPFEAYLSFAEKLCGKQIKFTSGGSCFFLDKTSGIGVAGINSAIGSGLIRDEKKIFDKGNLFIGEECIEKTTEHIQNCDIKFVLMHHPLSYFMDFDEKDIEMILCQRCDILLHGHLHVSEFRDVRPLRGRMRVVPGGSLFQSRELVNSYSIGTVDLKKRHGVIQYRRYSDINQEFVKDLDTTGEDHNGSYEFSLHGEK